MRSKLRHMLGMWHDAGLVVRLRLVTGDVIEGLIEEVDGDELVLEPVSQGQRLPIMVVMLDHVVTVQYTDTQLVDEPAPDQD
jgi:hypothetical protein